MVASLACRAAASTSPGEVTSSRTGVTPGSATRDGSRTAAYTLRAPRASKAWANARPTPRLAPVIKTLESASFMGGRFV
jgi:hypothetical protein